MRCWADDGLGLRYLKTRKAPHMKPATAAILSCSGVMGGRLSILVLHHSWSERILIVIRIIGIDRRIAS